MSCLGVQGGPDSIGRWGEIPCETSTAHATFKPTIPQKRTWRIAQGGSSGEPNGVAPNAAGIANLIFLHEREGEGDRLTELQTWMEGNQTCPNLQSGGKLLLGAKHLDHI